MGEEGAVTEAPAEPEQPPVGDEMPVEPAIEEPVPGEAPVVDEVSTTDDEFPAAPAPAADEAVAEPAAETSETELLPALEPGAEVTDREASE